MPIGSGPSRCRRLNCVRFAKRFRFKAFLLDTWGKDAKTLFDFVSPAEVGELVESLRRVEITVAIGGSLRPEHVKQLKAVTPDYYAVRSSVLRGGETRRHHRCGPRQEVEGRDQLSRFRHSDRSKGAKGASFYAFGTGTLAGQKLTITVANS